MSHEKVETNIGLMIVLITLVILVGGLIEIVPLFFMKQTNEPVSGLEPYTSIQLAGRDVYVSNGCYGCHSQMIRPFRAETERYGHYSLAGEFIYDRPFQWGSKRTGPDLHRVGGRYSDDWHRLHLTNPRLVVPESNMPGYPWFNDTPVDGELVANKMRALRLLNTPYTDDDIKNAPSSLEGVTEMDALIAYLQVLGTHVSTRR
ncbi:MAG: cytochrome-c oxidase, cbb3-type subunit II [Cycloclasticus sp.]|nr:cytochrome-c oxidase, cbb3-type subunit II [Cycloclasticus sp.]